MNYNTWKLVLISTASAQEKAQGTLENREDQNQENARLSLTIPISTKQLCKFFPAWQRWTYDIVAGARTCTTLVGLSLNFTKKVWVLDKPRLLLYRDLDTGYPSSQGRIFKFKWPHDQLHSVRTKVESATDEFIVSKLFCPVTSLHNIKYIYQNSTCFIFSNSIQYAAINCGIFTLPKDCS